LSVDCIFHRDVCESNSANGMQRNRSSRSFAATCAEAPQKKPATCNYQAPAWLLAFRQRCGCGSMVQRLPSRMEFGMRCASVAFNPQRPGRCRHWPLGKMLRCCGKLKGSDRCAPEDASLPMRYKAVWYARAASRRRVGRACSAENLKICKSEILTSWHPLQDFRISVSRPCS